jgi:hypothetical protein
MIVQLSKRVRTLTRLFSSAEATKKVEDKPRNYGNLSDKDRIFSNLYKDQDPFIEGAIKRVVFGLYSRVIGIELRIFLLVLKTLSLTK